MSAGYWIERGLAAYNMAIPHRGKKRNFSPKILCLLLGCISMNLSRKNKKKVFFWDLSDQKLALRAVFLIKRKTPTQKPRLSALAHFHCEDGRKELQKNKSMKSLLQHYKMALEVDPSCIRASIGAADVLNSQLVIVMRSKNWSMRSQRPWIYLIIHSPN